MRKQLLASLWLIVTVMLAPACTQQAETNQPETSSAKTKVAIFYGHGASETCSWEAEASARLNPNHDVTPVTTKDIAAGILDEMDVLVIPGGGGSTEFLNLGTGNHERMKAFVERGGGLVGICAGAYLISETPDYSCLSMSGGKAIDIEHDNRGRGVAKVTLTDEGKKWFPEVADRDTIYIMYYEGPVIVPANEEAPAYTVQGMMQSDVHVEGNAPENMTNNKPFYYLTPYGEGLVFSIVGHPEATPGMQWMLARAIEKVSPKSRDNEELYIYEAPIMNPDKFGREILMDKPNRQTESSLFQTLLYAGDEDKQDAMVWLREHNSWSAKRWLQGLLFDASPAVRKTAAETVEWTLYGYYLKDLKKALSVETDPDAKQAMEKALKTLEPYDNF